MLREIVCTYEGRTTGGSRNLTNERAVSLCLLLSGCYKGIKYMRIWGGGGHVAHLVKLNACRVLVVKPG